MRAADRRLVYKALEGDAPVSAELFRKLWEYATQLEEHTSALEQRAPTDAVLRAYRTLADVGVRWLRNPTSGHTLALKRAINRIYLLTKDTDLRGHRL